MITKEQLESEIKIKVYQTLFPNVRFLPKISGEKFDEGISKAIQLTREQDMKMFEEVNKIFNSKKGEGK